MKRKRRECNRGYGEKLSSLLIFISALIIYGFSHLSFVFVGLYTLSFISIFFVFFTDICPGNMNCFCDGGGDGDSDCSQFVSGV